MAGFVVEVEYIDVDVSTTTDLYGPYRKRTTADGVATRVVGALNAAGIASGDFQDGRAVTVNVRMLDDLKTKPIVAEAARFLREES